MGQRPSERRAEQRIDVNLEATLISGDVARPCLILNICNNGFLLKADEDLAVGEVVQLNVELRRYQAITCTVQIKHVNADRRGAIVLEMSDAERTTYRTFIEEERALQMEARSRLRAR